MSFNTISTERLISTEDFMFIVENMIGQDADQKGIAAALGISQASVSNYLRGSAISKSKSRTIAAAWNCFVETGVAPKRDEGVIDVDQDGTRPFVKVEMARDRQSGRLYPAAAVSSGLMGTVGGKIESDDQVVERIQGRFNVMTNILGRMLRNKLRSMVVRAAAGVGKTYTIEKILHNHADNNPNFDYSVLSGGGVSPFAMYKALYRARNGGVVVLDDNDSFLDAPETLNMLKNALDSSDKRVLTWPKRNAEVYDVHSYSGPEVGDDGEEIAEERIPSRFEFKGAMVFITNLDFQAIAESGSARAPHVAAMLDRGWYVNLTINNLRDKTLWCEHVFMTHMYQNQGLDYDTARTIVEYVKKNATKFFSLSLRLFKDIGDLAADPEGGDWIPTIEATKFRV